MSQDSGPLFVEERNYRRRRLADAARALPVAGAVLLFLPLLWARDDDREIALEAVYLFAVWAGLILSAALLSRALSARSRPEGPPPASVPEPDAATAPQAAEPPHRAVNAPPRTHTDAASAGTDHRAIAPREDGTTA